MSALEDRLRRELRAESEQITADSIPALCPRARGGRGRRLLSLAHGGGERQGAAARGWRGWLTPLAASIVVAAVIAGSGALSYALFRPRAPGRPPPAAVTELPSEAMARNAAVTWVLQQVSHAAVVACDTQVCADLVTRGFPSANLLPLEPASRNPLGSDLVMATATVRNQFGSRLAVWAPAIIATFGTGDARIDIRWLYPGGATAYRAALPAALRARKTADTQLLTNSHITFSATARTQLLSGQIDPRLPLLIVLMAHSHPLHIVDFASQSPGGGPASLLRSVDLATADSAAHLTRRAYADWMQRFIHEQRGQYRPAWSHHVTLRSGQAVLRIGYRAPSPLR